jgi:hypothetical protein
VPLHVELVVVVRAHLHRRPVRQQVVLEVGAESSCICGSFFGSGSILPACNES